MAISTRGGSNTRQSRQPHQSHSRRGSSPFFWLSLLVGAVFLTYSRVVHAHRVPATHRVFDVSDISDARTRHRVGALLAEYATQAGQALAHSEQTMRIFWSEDRTCFLPFFDRPFTVISWRDPVGPVHEHARLIQRFYQYAHSRHKQAALVCVSQDTVQVMAQRNSMQVWVGNEFFYNLKRYTTQGKSSKDLRYALNFARRLGATAREIFPATEESDRQALRLVEKAWKNDNPARKTGSFLRTAPLENAQERRYFAVEVPNASGERVMQCFITCSQVSKSGWCLQDLVRNPDAPRGCLEMAAVHAMETFKADGTEFVSMSIVPFYDPSGENSLSSLPQLAQWALNHFDRFYSFSGLQQFRAKFPPTHHRSVFVLLRPKIVTPMFIFDVLSVLSPLKRTL